MLGQMPAFNLREALHVLPLKLCHPNLGRSPTGLGRMFFLSLTTLLRLSITAIFTRI